MTRFKSCLIMQADKLAVYYSELKKTNCIPETVTVGFTAAITTHYVDSDGNEDTYTDYHDFKSREQAKKFLRHVSNK